MTKKSLENLAGPASAFDGHGYKWDKMIV